MMMLFFHANEIKKSKQYSLNIQRLKKRIAPLQVRNRFLKSSGYSGKRALSWASLEGSAGGTHSTGIVKKRLTSERRLALERRPTLERRLALKRRPALKGSLTLEAALSLPLFVFLCFCLMMPMKIMDRQRQIQAAAETVGEELSQYAYVWNCIKKGEEAPEIDVSRSETEDGDDFGGGDTSSLLETAYAAASILSRIDRRWVQNVSFAGTKIGEDDMIFIHMTYRMPLPFSVFGIKSIPGTTVCSRRMWTGAEGGRGSEKGGEGKEDPEDIVYIGKSSTRYHIKRTCHYLYNDLKQIPSSQVEDVRNQEGKSYKPCKSCVSSNIPAVCFIMPYGSSYHASSGCSAITAYVQAVPRKEVEHLGPCSYCGGL